MHLIVIFKIVGLLLMLFSFAMVPPLLVSFIYADSGQTAFLSAFVLILLAGLGLWLPLQQKKQTLHTRDGYMVAVLFWTILALAGSLPLYLADVPDMSFTDAFFESISGLTTTGTTVLTGLDTLPKSILFYRQQLQWLGGMGIVVLAVAVLPMLGVGSMQLYRTEAQGSMNSTKLTPRIKETARSLWFIYLALTLACGLCYWLAGMTLFDAIGHSFSTLSTGGFSSHDQNIAYFNSPLIESICMFFMLTSAMSFGLHFMAVRRRSLRHYSRDTEFQIMLLGITTTAFLVCLVLYVSDTYSSLSTLLRHGLFQSISAATTTGYALTNFANWPGLLPMTLVMISFIGASSGSTGGGIKVMRALLLVQQARREIRKLIHPHAVFLIKVGDQAVSDRTIATVWAFVGAYMALFILLMLVIMAVSPITLAQSFFAVASSMNNLGSGLGDISQHYPGINDASKWVLCFAMLLGRLEIFTLLVFISPAFWRR